MSIRIAYIGAGSFTNQCMFPQLARHGLELAAVCDLVEEKARLAQRRYGFKEVYTDFRKMLETEKPEAVFCVGGPKVHYPVGMEVLDRGFPLYIQKSPAPSAAATREMAEITKSAHLSVSLATDITSTDDTITIAKHHLKFSNPKINKQIEKHSNAIHKTMQMDTKRYRELMIKNKLKIDDNNLSAKNKAKEPNRPICKLVFLSERKEDLELNAKSVRIGKDPQSDILVKGFAVGKTSAVINKLPDGWYINYVGGISKPRLNNESIKEPIKLKKLDIISIGSTKLQFLIS